MELQKYSVNQQLIETVLAWVQSGEIAIPEIQRPFVWNTTKVRDLMDSLYQGFPVGYLVAWRNPNIRLKDGSTSAGKKILIDGQQRVTALRAAILGEYVVNKDYQRVKIKIAFNPVHEKFEVANPAILKNKEWIPDISEVLAGRATAFSFTSAYLAANPEVNQERVVKALENLFAFAKKQIGLIELAADLDIETVTEIFIRINSQGVVLSQADFAMSKIAANKEYGGQDLRKAIDYFCHLAVAPEFFQVMQDNDSEFAKTDYFKKMTWLRNENDDLYDPDYVDVLRVAFGLEFGRAKLSDLVSLLSGRNFETRTFEDEIAERSFASLRQGVMTFMNEIEFKRFTMIIRSAGFVDGKMVRSKNAMNFAYMLYLILRRKGENPALIEKYVRRWFVMMLLTGRSSGSFESQFNSDIQQLTEKDFGDFLAETESAVLSDAFWDVALVQSLESNGLAGPYFQVYLAAQAKAMDKGFLSADITVGDLIQQRGDIHHFFPKGYLMKFGLTKGKYNQIANYVIMQQEINIKLGNKPPKDYFEVLHRQIDQQSRDFGGILTTADLLTNLEMNCLPPIGMEGTVENYEAFLEQRRKLMAAKIRDYYFRL
ncbi:MAG: DUF262 domain-containing protein [Bacteroidetes bacterium]|nr:DUF262 domain-containing protein [Bacteroidota bacterium]